MTLFLGCPLWSDVPSAMTSLCLSPSVWWEKELCSVSHCKDVPMTHPCWDYSRWKSDSPRIMISPITRAMKWTAGSTKGGIKTFNEISRIIQMTDLVQLIYETFRFTLHRGFYLRYMELQNPDTPRLRVVSCLLEHISCNTESNEINNNNKSIMCQ